jgi:hypothetical protein
VLTDGSVIPSTFRLSMKIASLRCQLVSGRIEIYSADGIIRLLMVQAGGRFQLLMGQLLFHKFHFLMILLLGLIYICLNELRIGYSDGTTCS